MTDAIVIGYGNDLRRDDGAGRWVADQLEARDLPGVVVRSVSQLTPELSLEIAGRDAVVFVDADVYVTDLTVKPVPATPSTARTMTHHSNPATLLDMVSAVGDPPARAHVVSIPATDFAMGLEMTPATQAAAEVAIERVIELIGPTEAGD